MNTCPVWPEDHQFRTQFMEVLAALWQQISSSFAKVPRVTQAIAVFVKASMSAVAHVVSCPSRLPDVWVLHVCSCRSRAGVAKILAVCTLD